MPPQTPEKAPVTFQDVAACFSVEEWKLLHEWQKELFNSVMKEIQQVLISLGPLIASSVFSLRPKEKEDLICIDHEEFERRHAINQFTSDVIAKSDALFTLNNAEKQYLINPWDTDRGKTKDYPGQGDIPIMQIDSFNLIEEGNTYLRDDQTSERRDNLTISEEVNEVDSSVLSFRIKDEEEDCSIDFQDFVTTGIDQNLTGSICEDVPVHSGVNCREANFHEKWRPGRKGPRKKHLASMPLDYTVSQRGAKMLVWKGYLHQKDKEVNGKTFWKCASYPSYKCCSRVHTVGEEVKHFTPHNHLPKPFEVEVKKSLATIKEKALMSTGMPQEIIADISATLPGAVLGSLPSVPLLARTIVRRRTQPSYFPPIPDALSELKVDGDFSRTVKNEQFLLYDNSLDINRILIFGTMRNVEILHSARQLLVDGTFKTAPQLFVQLYTIHTVLNDCTVPLLYCLLSEKNEDIYLELFQKIRELAHDFEPQKILVDYELEAMKAIQVVWPCTQMNGCFFHFSQKIWRNLEQYGLQGEYIIDPEFALNIRCLAALAYVPMHDVIACFMQIVDTDYFTKSEEKLKSFVNYFENTYIGKSNRDGQRKAPSFSIEFWNVTGSIESNFPRVNSSIETWHNSFSRFGATAHLSIWKFINFIKKEQAQQEVRLEQHQAAAATSLSLIKYKDSSKRIEDLLQKYELEHCLEFLRGVASNFQLQM